MSRAAVARTIPPMDKVRLGFIGAGGMGQCAHLRNYLTIKDCQVVALAELRPKLAAAVGRRYDIPRVYTSDREMLKHERLDAIVSIQPYQAHGQLLPQLLQSKLPILIEKPLARSIEAADKILAAMAGSKLYLGYHKIAATRRRCLLRRRSKPGNPRAISGRSNTSASPCLPAIGLPAGLRHLITTDEPYPKLDFDPPPAGMDDAAAKAYDAFVNYYIHQVNLIRVLVGENYRVTYADPSGVLFAGTKPIRHRHCARNGPIPNHHRLAGSSNSIAFEKRG